jgi:hypothetical protein
VHRTQIWPLMSESGSITDMATSPCHVRFAPKSGHPIQALIHSFYERRIVVIQASNRNIRPSSITERYRLSVLQIGPVWVIVSPKSCGGQFVTFGIGEFDGIADEIDQDLGQAAAVAMPRRQAGRKVELERELLIGCELKRAANGLRAELSTRIE